MRRRTMPSPVTIATPVISLLALCPAATFTVGLNGTGDYDDIQFASDEASDGDAVVVKPGEYVIEEPIDFNRLHDPADPGSPPVKDITVRSEGGRAVTTIRMSETPLDPSRASVVVFTRGESVLSALEGFTLTGGKGCVWGPGGQTWKNGGGGMLFLASSCPRIVGCTITNNVSRLQGHGIQCWRASPTFIDCEFLRNGFSRETVGGGGGGAYCTESAAKFFRCTFADNIAYNGGAITIEYGSTIEMSRCLIANNQAGAGGGVFVYDGLYGAGVGGSATLVDCRIIGNTAENSEGGTGGGIFCFTGTTTVLTNCILAENTAGWRAGAIFCHERSYVTLVNCTLTRNTGAEGGGGVYCWDATAHTILVNSIVADNTPNSVCGKVASCLIGEDPLFIDPSDGDYRLAPSSPCIDAGICEVAPAFDIEGHPRPAGAGCDIGAYEFAGPGAPEYLRGDADADGDLTISDPIASLNYQFASSPPPTCLKTADINDDGRIDLADPVFELAYLFADGPAPPPPLRECGADPTADGLSCRSYGPCK